MQLDRSILVRSIRMAEPGSFISFDGEQLGIVIGARRPSILSLDSWKTLTCFDEIDEPLAKFDPVCVYGVHYMIRPRGLFQVGSQQVIRPGCLVLRPDSDIEIAHLSHNDSLRLHRLTDSRSIDAVAISSFAVCFKWSIVFSLASGKEQTFDFTV